MNSEEKILSLLEQMQEENNARFDSIETRLKKMSRDIKEIKKDTEITRVAANSLLAWADVAETVPKFKQVK